MRLGQQLDALLRRVLNLRGLSAALNLQVTGKWLLLSLAVGLVAGLGAAAFQWVLDAVAAVSWASVIGFEPPGPGGEVRLVHLPLRHDFIPWLLLVVPAVGGLVGGFIVFKLAPEAEGHGTDSAIQAYHEHGGRIRRRVPLVKLFASAITIGTGGSAGREGPIAQIGAGFGSFLADALHLSTRERRILLAAGLGAGVAAIFRAPIAGALFAAEVMYSEADFEHDVLVPATIASITGYSVCGLLFGFGHLFSDTRHLGFTSPLELGPYLLLAVLAAGTAMLFSWSFYAITRWFHRLPIPQVLKPALGGFMTGAVALVLYLVVGKTDVLAVMGSGYGLIQKAVSTPFALTGSGVAILALVAIGKVFTTGFSVGSGGSGGVFGPSMVIGGCLGGVVGTLFNGWWPEVVVHPGAYVLVGMAGFFAAAANTPISTLIMVSEMTGNYSLLVPTMWVCTLSFLIARRTGLYRSQVPNRLHSGAHADELIVDVLDRMRVREVFHAGHRSLLIPHDMPLQDIRELIPESRQTVFPVIDGRGSLVGAFSLEDIRPMLFDEGMTDLIIASDIAASTPPRVHPEDTLGRATKLMTFRAVDELPVVARDDPGRFLGLIKRREIVAAYNRRIASMRRT